MKSILALFSLSIAACGTSSPFEPGAGDNPGTGTGTLSIDGDATAHGRLTNALQASDFATDFSVRVLLNSVPVSTGTVTVTSSRGGVNLTYNLNGGGRWEGTANGYDEVYQLDVVSGADKVEGVRVDGPDIHGFTAPLAGASLDSTVANMVTWSRIEVADEAKFHADSGDFTIADSGTYAMPAGSLKADKTSARANTLQLTRMDRITPMGAIGGSQFTVRVENEIDVVALPCPGC